MNKKITKITTKQHKSQPTQTHESLRKEIDQSIQEIARLIDKNPKKAATILNDWVNRPSKSAKNKRAA